MNKNIKKNILIESIKSYDKLNESKKSSHPRIEFKDFLKDYFKDGETKNLSKYVKN
jgi:hypothetical protein